MSENTTERAPLDAPAPTPDLLIVNSPWGAVEYRRMIAPGAIFVETSSHGGAFLTAEANAQIPEALRSSDRFYEEDCEICAVIAAWPDYFTPTAVARAVDMCRNVACFKFRERGPYRQDGRA